MFYLIVICKSTCKKLWRESNWSSSGLSVTKMTCAFAGSNHFSRRALHSDIWAAADILTKWNIFDGSCLIFLLFCPLSLLKGEWCLQSVEGRRVGWVGKVQTGHGVSAQVNRFVWIPPPFLRWHFLVTLMCYSVTVLQWYSGPVLQVTGTLLWCVAHQEELRGGLQKKIKGLVKTALCS